MSSLFSHAWYGGLFEDQEIATLFAPEAELQRMRQIEIAWLKARASLGQIEAQLFDQGVVQIARCKIDADILRAGTATDGLPIPAFVRMLKAGMSDALASTIHTGLTSQDVLDTSLMLALRDVFAIFHTRLQALVDVFSEMALRDGENTLTGITRLQVALPIKAADRIENWARPMRGYIQEIDQFSLALNALQWGGPVGRRDIENADALGTAFAENLGLSDPGCAWHSTRSDIVALGSCAARISGSLGKFGQDVALMALQNDGQITLKTGGTSSAMPHKQNPILAELLVTLARYNASQLAGLTNSLVHEFERSGAAWAYEWMCLPDMLQCCGAGLNKALELAAQIETLGLTNAG